MRPYVQGKMMSEKICGYANIVAFMEIIEDDDDNTIRRFHTRESSRWYAKDQYDAFADGYVDNPTLPQLMQLVEKSRGGRKPAAPKRGRGTTKTTTTRRRGTRA